MAGVVPSGVGAGDGRAGGAATFRVWPADPSGRRLVGAQPGRDDRPGRPVAPLVPGHGVEERIAPDLEPLDVLEGGHRCRARRRTQECDLADAVAWALLVVRTA